MKLVRPNKLLIKRRGIRYIIIDPRWLIDDKELDENGYYVHSFKPYYYESINLLNKYKIKYKITDSVDVFIGNRLYISPDSLEVVS